MPRSALRKILFTVCILLLLLAIATVVPHSSPMISVLGYETWCPFAPWSTLTLLFGAGLAWAVRGYLGSRAL